jgi:single-stranded-DNA-specific exonuclease
MTEIVQRPYATATTQQLTDSGMPALLARIYAARGIASSSQLDTGLSRLLPFTQLKNAQQMACLLADAIAANRKLLIVADYDADGATACAVGMRGLRALGAQVDFIVPNRFEYGYGQTHNLGGQAIAILKAVGHDKIHLRAQRAQAAQADRTGGCAIGIVIGHDQ